MNAEQFAPSFGNRPPVFVGRSDILEKLVKGLKAAPGTKGRAVVLLGQRGSGKTVLLWELADKAKAMGWVIASPTIAAEGMLARVIEKAQDSGEAALASRKSSLTGASFGVFGFSAGLQFTKEVQESKSNQYKLQQLVKALNSKKKGLLILVDELQANNNDVRQLIISYQEMVGEGLDVALVMAGLPGAVSGTLNDKVLTFLYRAQKEELEPLKANEVCEMYVRAFKDSKIKISSGFCREAAKATMGSPYMMQLIGHYITVCAQNGTVNEEQLRAAIEYAQEDFQTDVCGSTLEALSETDVAFLVAMASVEGPVKVATVAEIMNVKFDYAQKYRKRLLDAGVICAPQRGSVDFAVPYLEDYLKRQVS